MAVVPTDTTEETTLTFNLGLLFDENSVEVEQLDATYIQDSELVQLIENVNANSAQIEQIQVVPNQDVDDAGSEVKPKSKRFPDINDQQIDEIANYNTKQKTKKQTIWGVKVFRGT